MLGGVIDRHSVPNYQKGARLDMRTTHALAGVMRGNHCDEYNHRKEASEQGKAKAKGRSEDAFKEVFHRV